MAGQRSRRPPARRASQRPAQQQRPPNPAAERGVMAMRIRSSMSHGYAIEVGTRSGGEMGGLVTVLSNDHTPRRAESDRARSNLRLRFKNGDTVALEELTYVRRAGN